MPILNINFDITSAIDRDDERTDKVHFMTLNHIGHEVQISIGNFTRDKTERSNVPDIAVRLVSYNPNISCCE
jgi:predicted ATP-binding protein involved in virulence